MTANEWEGDIHVLTVHAVRPPLSQFDDGELDCDIEHPPTCKKEDCGYPGVTVMIYTCDVAQADGDVGLAYSLRYSGTPVNEPGTYRIRGWGRKYRTELGYEYDGGVGIVTEDEANGLCGSRQIRPTGSRRNALLTPRPVTTRQSSAPVRRDGTGRR